MSCSPRVRSLPLIASVVVLAMAGCEYFPSDENTAKHAVRERLLDPSSGQFERVFKGKAAGSTCGWVNAKNRMGAFVGRTAWFYEASLERVTLAPEPATRNDFERYYRSIGSDEQVQLLTEIHRKCEFPAKWEATCGITPPAEFENGSRFCPMLDNTRDLVREMYKEFDRH